MSNRLPVDTFVQAYLGFDEANDGDVAFDESTYAQNFTFTGSPVAVVGRVGNSRQFDGSAVFCSPPSSTPFQVTGDLTLITWGNLTQVNSSGSTLRTLICCDGTTAGSAASNMLFGLFVNLNGAVVFRHDHGNGVQTVWTTANSVVATSLFNSLAIIRSISAGVATVLLYVNNKLVPWATVTDNGSPTASPPAPTGGSSSTLKVGKSDLASDKAFWFGAIDELSIHNIARQSQPYLISAYYSVALASPLSKLTAYNNIKSVGSAEMGGGNRWWTYERSGDLYVVRESSLGLFSAEVKLTTAGVTGQGGLEPATATSPSLIFDPTTGDLVVLFAAASRVYRITALATDVPVTQNMPYSTDSSSIIKAADNVDLGRMVSTGGSGQTPTFGADPTPPRLAFVNYPSFGVAMPFYASPNLLGFAVFQDFGGQVQQIGTMSSLYLNPFSQNQYWFFALSGTRQAGNTYYVVAITAGGQHGKNTLGNQSNAVVDYLGEVSTYYAVNYPIPSPQLFLGVDHDNEDVSFGPTAAGGPAWKFSDSDLLVTVNRQPLKVQAADPNTVTNTFISAGGPAWKFSDSDLITIVNRQPLKMQEVDPDTVTNTFISAGASDGVVLHLTRSVPSASSVFLG